MPELPEVETIRKQLDSNIVGKSIAAVEIFNPKSFIGNPKDIIGKKILGTRRIGKMLVIDLSDNLVIGVHLKMSGQLLIKNSKFKINNWHKHTRAIFKFKSGEELHFVDQRIFGWVRVMKKSELINMTYVKNLGPEPWDITDKELADKLKNKSKAIKVVLTDQDVISGVGNIYANDALWLAGINPIRKSQELKFAEIQLLRKSLVKVLREGIKLGGSTGSDGQYVDLEGNQGLYQNKFKVYERKGELCLHGDGGVIVKIKLGGRGTYFCPRCQK